MSTFRPRERSSAGFVNGKWLAQSASGTQRYATQVMTAISATPVAERLVLVLPRDALVPSWAGSLGIVRSRLRGTLFEQVALPWITRGGHLYSFAGPAPVAKRDQTVVMHDAMPFRYPDTFHLLFVLWYRFLYRVLSRTATRMLTVSSFSRSELAEVLGVPEERFGLAPCGSDHVPELPGAEEDDLPFPRGRYALLVGNLAPHKNFPAVLSALADAGVPVAVVGGEQRRVFRTTTTLGRDNVRFLGRVDDARLSAVYAGAGVFVAPSRYEGFGIPIVEAGRLGCPSVFATGSAMAEVAGDGGLPFDPDDTGRCVQLVTHLLADACARADLARRARANAQRFTWAATANTIFLGDDPTRDPTASAPRPGDDAPDPSGPRRLRVLHVTETFAAGTGVAIASFARATRDQGTESFLVAQDRGSGLLDELRDDCPFSSARILAPGLLALWRGVRADVRAIRPDLVHVHSSVAGAVVRLATVRAAHPPIVYSPHCFAFERRDVPPLRRWAFRMVERLLARRTAGFVCVSPHEAALARHLNRRAFVDYVVNSFGVFDHDAGEAPPAPSDAPPPADDVLRLVTSGRISPQKDPAMFAEVVTALRATGGQVEATWIGAGDDRSALAALGAAGVRVTGWIPANRVPCLLNGHSVYVHTAAWEAAAPIAALEAMATGLVVAVRRIDAYRDMLRPDWQFDDVPEAVAMIRELCDPSAREARIRDQFATLRTLRERVPVAVLGTVYREIRGRTACGSSPSPWLPRYRAGFRIGAVTEDEPRPARRPRVGALVGRAPHG